MTKKLESPCKICPAHPCKHPQKCEERWEYVQTLNSTIAPSAVDMNAGYRILIG